MKGEEEVEIEILVLTKWHGNSLLEESHLDTQMCAKGLPIAVSMAL